MAVVFLFGFSGDSDCCGVTGAAKVIIVNPDQEAARRIEAVPGARIRCAWVTEFRVGLKKTSDNLLGLYRMCSGEDARLEALRTATLNLEDAQHQP